MGNPDASKTGISKVQAYMQKFGRTKEQVIQMASGMKKNFDAVGLPFSFEDGQLTGNTFNGHRLLTLAATKGLDVQDKVQEELFKNYFAEGKFPNDPQVLIDAAVVGGIDRDEAQKLVQDETAMAVETQNELKFGRELRVTGVPYFVLSAQCKKVAVSGAQPEEVFLEIAAELTGVEA